MSRARVAVVGAGYAGISVALGLARLTGGAARIRLIDVRPEHQLITRLHLVAAERIAPAGAAVPLAELLGGSGVRCLSARVVAVDLARSRLETTAGPQPYDYLVLATGSEPDDHGVPGVGRHALPLRTLADAERLRAALRERIRRAALSRPPDRRRRLTFLVVGGGYSGVELAAELAPRLRSLAARAGLAGVQLRISLLEAAPRLVPGHDRWLAQRAEAALARAGVQVLTSTPVVAVEEDGVVVAGGDRLRAGTVIWTAGVRAPRLLAASGLPVGAAGRVRVGAQLLALGHPDVLVVGDSALLPAPPGQTPPPPTAQLALQQANLAAGNLAAWLGGRSGRHFWPADAGEVISLGPGSAAAVLRGVRLEGLPAVVAKQVAEGHHLHQLGGICLVGRQLARGRGWLGP